MFSSLQNFELPITLIAPVLMFYGKLSRPLAKTDLFSIKTQWHSNERGGCWVRSDHLSCPENNQLKAVFQTETSSVLPVYVEVDKLEQG